ncbi:MAG: DUF4965 domain-containing protein [Tepidisphaeraceae bacterium]
MLAFRPPSVPLVVNSPYLNVWSNADKLTDTSTKEWHGRTQSLVSLVRVDGVTYRLMGTTSRSLAALPQTGVSVTPTRTIYDFQNAKVHVTLTFTTADLPSNLDILTRPVTYETWDVRSVDGASHAVQLYTSVSSQLATTDDAQVVTWGRENAGSLSALKVGNASQNPLDTAGDRVGINWGYAYLAAGSGATTQGDVTWGNTAIDRFASTGALTNTSDAGTRAVNSNEPVMAFALQLGNVGTSTVSRHAIVGYDELYTVNYFGQRLQPYWRRNYASMNAVLSTAESQYASVFSQCVAFDAQLTADLSTSGGAQYAQIAALAYRQAFGSMGVAKDRYGQPLVFTKEQSSNGDIATTDVIFPTFPLLLNFSPSLARSMLVPVLAYSASGLYMKPFAPHDLGVYPNSMGMPVNGEDMPVEESANMILMVAALAKQQGSLGLASQYWGVLTQWAEYLKPYAYDPGTQLTTDDFLGTIKQSVNLAIKATEALGAYAMLAKMKGDTASYNTYRGLAQTDAAHLLQVGYDGNHFELGYGQSGTWSLKYNLVWDKLLGLNLFSTTVVANEIAWYKSHLGTFGTPLESTRTITKIDWEVWAASMATNQADFQTLITPAYNYYNTTTVRTPMGDGYDVNNAASNLFTVRSVVGGVFIKLMSDPAMWRKYYTQDKASVYVWAPFPVKQTILPTGSTWKYTTSTPANNWTSKTFNDSAWSTGTAGFGTNGTPGVNVVTPWNTSDIYLRKTVTLPSGTLNGLAIFGYHDEDLQVYVNDVLACSVGGYVTGNQLYPINTAGLVALKPGTTVQIAVHVHQSAGGQGVDVGLVNMG